MGSKKTRTTSARRARIEEMRRAEAARERRNRSLTYSAIAVVLVGLIGGGTYLIVQGNNKDDAREADKAAPVKGVQTWDDLGRDHVSGKVDYPMKPPAGGNHNQVWQNCDGDVYTEEIQPENAVHSLEHGAVWVTHTDDAPESDVKTLTSKVEETPYTLLSPYKDQDSPITLTAWGNQLKVDTASDPRVEKFLTKYVQGEQTPEKGAACTGGIGG